MNDECLSTLGNPFVVLTHPALLNRPRKAPLHYPPPPGQHDKAFRIWRRLHPLRHPYPATGTLDDLGATSQHLPYSVARTLLLAVVASVQPQMLHAREQLFGVPQQQLYPVALSDFGRMDLHLEQQTLSIDEDVALCALYLLASIITALLSAHAGTLERLAVHAARTTRLGISPKTDSKTRSRIAALILSQAPST